MSGERGDAKAFARTFDAPCGAAATIPAPQPRGEQRQEQQQQQRGPRRQGEGYEEKEQEQERREGRRGGRDASTSAGRLRSPSMEREETCGSGGARGHRADGNADDVDDDNVPSSSGAGSGAGRLSGSVDFFCPRFDALLALGTPGLEPPEPGARPMDNVAKCRAILPQEHPDALCHVVRKASSEASRQKAAQLKAKAARQTQSVLDSCTMSLEAVHGHVKAGPLAAALGGWLAAGARVRVVTRHHRGVRGAASGVLVAYDRFLNLVLRDVDEAYTVRVRTQRAVGGTHGRENHGAADGPRGGVGGNAGGGSRSANNARAGDGLDGEGVRSAAPGGPASCGGMGRAGGAAGGRRAVCFVPSAVSASDDQVEPGELGEVAVVDEAKAPTTKWAFKQEHRQRRLGQIFIKGDSVVTVSLESQYRPVACASARQPERIEQRG